MNDNANDNANVNDNDNAHHNDNECVNTDYTQCFPEEEREEFDIFDFYWHNQFVRGEWTNKYMLTDDEFYACLTKTIRYVKMNFPEWGDREIRNFLPKEIEKYSRTPKGTLKERREELQNKMERYKSVYSTEMLHDFWQYWTQVDEYSGLQKYEKEDCFELGKRLDLWHRNEKGYGVQN